ncbi:MAG: DEAD/DEAH box helicase family protein [Deltaproteobacteria bacterium]|nr:DEAD/DEAH box helicase family protein [Deltaproteobacteria bacterium]
MGATLLNGVLTFTTATNLALQLEQGAIDATGVALIQAALKVEDLPDEGLLRAVLADRLRRNSRALANILAQVPTQFLGTSLFANNHRLDGIPLPHVVERHATFAHATSAIPVIRTAAAEEANGDTTVPYTQQLPFDDAKTSPEDLLSTIEKELARVRGRHETIRESLTADENGRYEKRMELAQERLQFWRVHVEALPSTHGKDKNYYRIDILIGAKTLLNRVLTLGAEIFAEDLPAERLARTGLQEKEKPKPEEGIVSALVNEDVGFGSRLSLRPHQQEALKRIRGALRLREGQMHEHNGDGTITLPTGGGKTRIMVAGFAEAIRQGAFQIGDKLIILNHTEQIHTQNLEVSELLQDYFQKTFSRPLKVTEYKADKKDLSGDIIVVSIPSINTETQRKTFESQMRAELGASGKIAMTAVDEIHHLELGSGKTKESWKMVIELLRAISPNFYRLGFTATPTGREGPYIFRLRESILMRAGVTPRTYLVPVKGIELTQLKVSQQAEDFAIAQLVSTLLGHPERNKNIFRALEEKGLRRLKPSPSGKERLEATLFFAADLKHAAMMAEDYLKYFGTPGEGLKNRKLTLLGKDRGKITPKELERTKQAWQDGKTDGIAVVVSGQTSPALRQTILEMTEEGIIEAVFNVDVWYEGSDLYMFSHLVGSRPTFSRFKKGQERGRLNRRGPDEVTPEGRLLSDPPKILFDVKDEYKSMEHHLVLYSELLGIPGTSGVNAGELFDAMSGAVVTTVDREGKGIRRKSVRRLMKIKVKAIRPSADVLLKPIVAKLWEILETQYHRDVEMMAMDLGLPLEAMQEILRGEGWANKRWFLRRMSTLLYREREELVDIYNDEREIQDEKVTDADIALLEGALAVYETNEGKISGEIVIEGDAGWGDRKIVIARQSLEELSNRTLGDQQFRKMWTGLRLYFGLKKNMEWIERMEKHLFEREKWEHKADTAQEAILWRARNGVARHLGGKLLENMGDELPGQSETAPLTQWLKGEKIQFSSRITAQELYRQVRVLLIAHLKMEEKEALILIEEAVFEERGWSRENDTQKKQLLLEARKRVAIHFGGKLVNNMGDELPAQKETTPLARWLKGKFKFNISNPTPQEFYREVRILLTTHLKMGEKEALALIEEAIFEEQGWKKEDNTDQKRLLLETRKRVAIHFGGKLLKNMGDELPRQRETAPLTQWLKGEKIQFSFQLTTKEFYRQVRVLLTAHLKMEEKEALAFIEEAIFEEQDWGKEDDTAQKRLLLETRKKVARHFGGRLSIDTGLPGLSKQPKCRPLTRWIQGDTIPLTESLLTQIRALLEMPGTTLTPADIDRLLDEVR